MTSHLTCGLWLDAGVQQPVPDSVEDVSQKLQYERGPDPRSSRPVLHDHLRCVHWASILAGAAERGGSAYFYAERCPATRIMSAARIWGRAASCHTRPWGVSNSQEAFHDRDLSPG